MPPRLAFAVRSGTILVVLLVSPLGRVTNAATHARASSPPTPHAVRVPIGVELGGEAWDTERLIRNPTIRAELERLSHEGEEEEESFESLPPGAVGPPFVVQALGTDVCVNDRSLSTCVCSGGRPISQTEASVAAWGPYVVVSWNDRRGVCLGGVQSSQSHAYSTDHGATFHEGGLLRGPGPNDFFHGDPTVAVNRNTGMFYISGILRQTNTFVGIVALRGHFVADTFAIDTRRVVALAQGFDFLDKPWMAVDPASGHVYVTWTNFHADYTGAIELQRLDANLDPLGPVVVVTHPPYGAEGPQGSFPTVGANGELYVPYGMFYSDTLSALWSTPSRFEIRRSDDDGLTFGPPSTIATVQYHPLAIVAGNQRGFWADLFAMDVDRSTGPHRGRAYVVWSEHRPLGGVPYGSNVVVEQESNDFFARATAFTPGDLIRAGCPGSEKDRFRFTGHRGEVFWCTTDSASLALRARMLCFADTTSLATYRLFYSRASNGAGDFAFAAGLPYDGTYYLEVENQSPTAGSYLVRTGLAPASPGDRARDIRDIYLSWSDDGATWSAPLRLNDDDPWFDASDPQVVVDGKGRVHTFWFDWRDDLECGTSSNQYGRSSGDGGVTWGPNRRLTDASSFWGNLSSCSDNNQGDFTQMAASEDHVYSAFADSRLGDPDIFLDASTYRSTPQCPPARLVLSGADTQIDFSLVNGGNFATPLAWSLADGRGWLTGALPGASGSQTLAANGGAVAVAGTFHPPGGCGGVDDTVRFVTWDPNIPGAYDTCVTVLTCSPSASVPIVRIQCEAGDGRVRLEWRSADAAGATARLYRRDSESSWQLLATLEWGADGTLVYQDRGVAPGRHQYRVVVASAEGATLVDEVWVEVPALELALRGAGGNPSRRGPLTLAFTLPTSAPARLDVLDPAGRRLVSRDLAAFGAGRHEVTLAETGALPSGVYLIRLRQGMRSVSQRTAVIR